MSPEFQINGGTHESKMHIVVNTILFTLIIFVLAAPAARSADWSNNVTVDGRNLTIECNVGHPLTDAWGQWILIHVRYSVPGTTAAQWFDCKDVGQNWKFACTDSYNCYAPLDDGRKKLYFTYKGDSEGPYVRPRQATKEQVCRDLFNIRSVSLSIK